MLKELFKAIGIVPKWGNIPKPADVDEDFREKAVTEFTDRVTEIRKEQAGKKPDTKEENPSS